MNATLTIFLCTRQSINITNLNAIHYTAAVILAGTTKHQPQTVYKGLKRSKIHVHNSASHCI